MKTEIWKDIPDYKGLYQASNLGRIKGLALPEINMNNRKRHKERLMKQRKFKAGYYMTNLSNNGIKKSHRINRLIALAFIPNPKNKPYVNHIDGIKTNNNIKNLEWVTHIENEAHAVANNLKAKGEKVWCAKLNNEIANKIRTEYIPHKITRLYLSKKYKVSKTIIDNILSNKTYK